jgi:hypothetical protein
MKILSITKSAIPFLWIIFFEGKDGKVDYKWVTLDEYIKLT